jgi:hypothetical protein
LKAYFICYKVPGSVFWQFWIQLPSTCMVEWWIAIGCKRILDTFNYLQSIQECELKFNNCHAPFSFLQITRPIWMPNILMCDDLQPLSYCRHASLQICNRCLSRSKLSQSPPILNLCEMCSPLLDPQITLYSQNTNYAQQSMQILSQRLDL